MKRLTAKRRLRRTCDTCSRTINKGEVYYKERNVFACGGVIAFNRYICPRCAWKEQRHKERFERFKERCEHPERFWVTRYSYIPGEYVMEPSHSECWLCGQRIH